MKILITGGAGFIGSHLVEFLEKKSKVKKLIIIDNLEDGSLKNLKKVIKSKKIKFYKRDIRNFNSIYKLFKNIDKVIHLAALSDIVPSINYPKDYLETNDNGTINVLESMRKFNVKKIIYAASSSCYGIPRNTPTKENSNLNPRYPYAFSKIIGEQVIKHWSKIYKINFISLRLFNVYGTRSRTNTAYGAALGIFLKQKIENKPYTIVGNGKQKRDFIYVKDVCKAFYLSTIKNINNEIFNIGFGVPRSVNELVKILDGKKIRIPKRPGEPNITHANISKAKIKLGWKPVMTLEKGIGKVLENIDYWKNAPLWDKKSIKTATKDWFKYLK